MTSRGHSKTYLHQLTVRQQYTKNVYHAVLVVPKLASRVAARKSEHRLFETPLSLKPSHPSTAVAQTFT